MLALQAEANASLLTGEVNGLDITLGRTFSWEESNFESISFRWHGILSGWLDEFVVRMKFIRNQNILTISGRTVHLGMRE